MYPGRQRFFGSFLMPDIGSLSDVDGDVILWVAELIFF